MPYTIETKDGITINDIPDDIKPDDQRLKDRVAQIRAERSAGGPITGEQQAQASAQPEAQQGTDWLGGMAHNLGVAGRGAIQGVSSLVTVPADFLTALTNVAKNGWNAPAVQLPSEALADTLTKVGVPQAQNTAEQILQATTGALSGTGTQIAAGQAMNAGRQIPALIENSGKNGALQTVYQTQENLTPNAAGQVLASQPAQQAAGAVGSSLGSAGAQQLAQETGADQNTQQAASLVGGLLGGTTAAGATGAGQRIWNAVTGNKGVPTTPQEQMVANANGKPLMTSDVFPPKGGAGQLYQTLSERNPFLGTGPLRAGQQEARIGAVRDLINDYGASTDSAVFNSASDATMADLANLRKSELGKYTGMKNEVIDRLSFPMVGQEGGVMRDVGTSSPTAAMAQGQLPPVNGLQPAQGGYSVRPNGGASAQGVTGPANQSDLSRVVPMTKTNQAIDDTVAFLKQLKTQDVQPVIAKLEDWKNSVQGQDLRNVEWLRKQIGESFKAPELSSVRTTAEKALSGIYGAVREDMGNFIKANGKPDDYRTWMVANKQLSDMMGDLKNQTLATTLKKGDATPEVVQRMLFSAKPSDVQALYRNLTPVGQANARAAILSKAAQNALTAGTDSISPEKFSTQVQKLGGPIGVFFSSDDKAQIEGLVKYLNSTRRASEAVRNPSTGYANIIPQLGIGGAGLAGGGIQGLAATVGSGLALGAFSRAYESAPVRNTLIALAKAKPNSQEESALTKRIAQSLTANFSLMESDQKKAQGGQ